MLQAYIKPCFFGNQIKTTELTCIIWDLTFAKTLWMELNKIEKGLGTKLRHKKQRRKKNELVT